MSKQPISKSIFKKLLKIMQLRKAQTPSIEIDYSSLPPDLDVLKIKPLPPETDRLNENKIGILDLLGVYVPADRKVIIYDLRIRICAGISGIDYQELYDIVLCHELAHAATHLGLDQSGEIWTSFGAETALTIEYFAQIYTYLFFAKKQNFKVNEAMQKLSITQPHVYQTYLRSRGKSIFRINNALLQARHSHVRLQSTRQALVNPQQQDHWVEVIVAPVQCPPIVWYNRDPNSFKLEMKFSIRYNLGQKGTTPLKSIDYPLCGMVYFKPCGRFEFDDMIFDFSSPDDVFDYYYLEKPFSVPASGCRLASDCHLNDAKDLYIKTVCTPDDFKDIEDYFKESGNIVKYFKYSTSKINGIRFIQQH